MQYQVLIDSFTNGKRQKCFLSFTNRKKREYFMSLNNFFKEWKDSRELLAYSGLMTILMFIALTWTWINVAGESVRAGLYLWLLVVAAITGGIDTQWEKNRIWGYNDYGNSKKFFIAALFFGLIFGIALQASNFSIATFSIINGVSLLSFFYIVVAAPYVEEKFFRGWLEPTIGVLTSSIKSLKQHSYILGVVFSALVFAIFHYVVYAGDLPALFSALIFGVSMSIGNHLFKSRGFGIAAHIINNFLVIGGFAALMGLI